MKDFKPYWKHQLEIFKLWSNLGYPKNFGLQTLSILILLINLDLALVSISILPGPGAQRLGSIAPKQPPSQLTTSKLHSHPTKKAKKDGENNVVKAKNSDNHPEQIDGEEDEEDSACICNF
ncbi:hypothetical protein MJO29_014120 [Puccinia striiformis f. sp. tritici]|nr:hypothetical protein MJO29_014120 [Puccinia striiformis f. sp. tritici]